MQHSSIPSLVGVAVSLVVVWFLHGFLMIDNCLDSGGTFDYSTNQCMASDGAIITKALNNSLIVLYCIVIMVLSLLVAKATRKIICKFKT